MRTQLFLHDSRRRFPSPTSRIPQSVGSVSNNALISSALDRADETAQSSGTRFKDRVRFFEFPKTSVRLNFGERKLDLLWVAISVGLAIFTWEHAVREAYTPIWLYVILNIQCAVLFAIRHPAQLSSLRPLEIFLTLVSVNYFFAFNPMPISSSAWALLGGIISTVGAFLTFVSVQSLGRSFAVFPSLRAVQTSGSYRFVRHPIYLSYIVTALGIVVRHPTVYNGAVALAGITLILCRMRFEERLLAQESAYRDYMARVRYRLIPGLY